MKIYSTHKLPCTYQELLACPDRKKVSDLVQDYLQKINTEQQNLRKLLHYLIEKNKKQEHDLEFALFCLSLLTSITADYF